LKALFLSSIFLLSALILRAQTSLDTAVNFTVKDVSGVTHRLDEYLGQDKIVVIDFFTITCGPCSTYAPLINESYNHFGCNTSNVIFLGINWGANNAGVIDFGNSNGVHYPEISGTEGNGNHVVADYGILSYPTVILIRPDRFIAEKYIWPPETNYLDSIIQEHGGILSSCNTSFTEYYYEGSNRNRILSLYPIPAQGEVTCFTSVTEPGSLQVVSITGKEVSHQVPVLPCENCRMATRSLLPGYYLMLLRDKNGVLLDRKPLIIK